MARREQFTDYNAGGRTVNADSTIPSPAIFTHIHPHNEHIYGHLRIFESPTSLLNFWTINTITDDLEFFDNTDTRRLQLTREGRLAVGIDAATGGLTIRQIADTILGGISLIEATGVNSFNIYHDNATLQLRFDHGGTLVFTITGDEGKCSIGLLSTADATLHIKQAIDSRAGGIRLESLGTGNAYNIYMIASDSLITDFGTGKVMETTSAGRTGIGNILPLAGLHVKQIIDSNLGGLRIENLADANRFDIFMVGGELTFERTGTRVMELKQTGRLGIGNIAPLAGLHVKQIIDSELGGLRIENLGDANRFDIFMVGGELRFERTGTPVMELKQTGRLGVGNIAPLAGLHLKQIIDSNLGGLRIENLANSNQYDIFMVGGELRFERGGNRVLEIEQTGRLGVGNIAPASGLHLKQVVDSNIGGLRIENTGDANRFDIYMAGNNLITEFGGTQVSELLSTGQLGVGLKTPAAGVHIKQIADAGGNGFRMERTGASTQFWEIFLGAAQDMFFNFNGVTDTQVFCTDGETRSLGQALFGSVAAPPQAGIHLKQAADTHLSGLRIERSGAVAFWNQYMRLDGALEELVFVFGNTATNGQIRFNNDGHLAVNVPIATSLTQQLLVRTRLNTAAGGFAITNTAEAATYQMYPSDNTGTANLITALNGTDLMHLTDVGRLGLGITPLAGIHIKQIADTNVSGLRIEDTGSTDHYDLFMVGNSLIKEFNGTKVQEITSAGRQGVGVIVPLAGIHIKQIANSDVGGIRLEQAGGTNRWDIFQDASDVLTFAEAGVVKFTVDDTGKGDFVGDLDVAGNVDITGTLDVTGVKNMKMPCSDLLDAAGYIAVEPTAAGKFIRHACVESDRPIHVYSFTVDCSVNIPGPGWHSVIPTLIPNYLRFLNDPSTVKIQTTARGRFATSYAYLANGDTELHVHALTQGLVDVTIVVDRALDPGRVAWPGVLSAN